MSGRARRPVSGFGKRQGKSLSLLPSVDCVSRTADGALVRALSNVTLSLLTVCFPSPPTSSFSPRAYQHTHTKNRGARHLGKAEELVSWRNCFGVAGEDLVQARPHPAGSDSVSRATAAYSVPVPRYLPFNPLSGGTRSPLFLPPPSLCSSTNCIIWRSIGITPQPTRCMR